MRVGAFFPQTEFGNDPLAIRDYVRTAEGLGFTHILTADHVLGGNPHTEAERRGQYTYETPFHEPFVLLSYMAALAERLSFGTAILILPQRQSALVAKQAATLDVLCGGRFRLGVGVGWNPVEFEALNQDFHSRGRRIEEQIELLRRLWREPLVTFEGKWERIPDAGINPLPVRRSIPLWLGGHADVVLKRVARLADGWFPLYRTAAEAQPHLDTLRRYLEEAGRSATDVAIEPRLRYHDGPGTWAAAIEAWNEAGATHLHLDTRESGLTTPDEHINALVTFAETVGLTPQSTDPG